MRRVEISRASVVAIATSLGLALVTQLSWASTSQTYVGNVTARPTVPVTLQEGGHALLGRVDFGRRFTSIDSLCFSFAFKRNLLDTGDEVEIALNHDDVPSPIPGGFGFLNPGPDSQSARTICLVAGFHDEQLSLLLDGKQDFQVRMFSGSVRIVELKIVLTGAAH